MHTFFHAFSEADPFGKMIFFCLFALSALSWFFLIYKIWMLFETKKKALQFSYLIKQKKDSLLHLKMDKLTHPFGKLYAMTQQKTVEILDKNHYFSKEPNHYLSRSDIELLDSHQKALIAKEREKLEKHLFVLPMTISLAPFLGLLGTVWGILITFGELQAGQTVTSSAVMLGGLSTALTTTVLGLLIAIPALVAFSYLKNQLRYLSLEMHDFSHFLLSTVELQYRKVDIP